MACCTSRRPVLVVLSATAVLLAVVFFGAATTTAASAAAASAAPSYCAVGKAIPGCVWYVASRSCDVVAAMLPNRASLRATCCGQLQNVPAECRCRALRVMMETTPLVVGADPGAQRRCRAAQARFAPAVVAAGECGLRTVHGWPFCNALDAE